MIAPFQFSHPAGVTITANLARDVLERFVTEHPQFRPEDCGEGWIWHPLPSALSEGKEIGFKLGFRDDSLQMVQLFDLNPELYGKDWDEWDREKEQLRAANTGAWLESVGYSAGQYEWGSIGVGFDEKSHCGLAFVNYSQAQVQE